MNTSPQVPTYGKEEGAMGVLGIGVVTNAKGASLYCSLKMGMT